MTVAVRSPSSPAPAPAHPNRRADIQGLRAVAVLLVVAFHAGLPVPGGFVGVDVFFVISGFVITAMLMRQWASTGRLAFGAFYLRRFLRLTPALALTVTVVALISVLVENPFGAQQSTARTGLGAMLLSANAVIAHSSGDYFAASAVTSPLLNTWSLSVEEQFYLVFPALLVASWLLARRHRSGHAVPVLVIGTVAIASFAAAVACTAGWPGASGLTDFFGGPETFSFYSPFTRAWEFAAGAVLALTAHRLRTSRSGAVVAGVLGASLIVLAALAIDESQQFPGVITLIPVVGTLLLLVAGSGHGTGISALLARPTMVWIGDRSYSWYLWHWPVIVFAVLLIPGVPWVPIVAAIASVIPAALSYRFVEQPLRRLRPRSRMRAAGVIGTTIAIPLVACLALLAGANSGWGLVPPASAASVVAPRTGPDGATADAASGGPDAGTGTAVADGETAEADGGTAVADGEVAGGEGGSLRSQHVVVRAGCVNTDLEPERCRFGPADARGTILLAGDSQAYAVADGVIQAAADLGYDTVVTSHTGCPFLGRESSGVHNYPCRSWQRDIVEYVQSARPAAVVIANRSGGYVQPGLQWRTAARDDGRRATSVDEAADLWRAGLADVVAPMRDAGVPVVILSAVPEMPGYTNRTSLLGGVLGSRDFTIPRETAEQLRAPAVSVEQSIAVDHPGTVLHDPFPALCDDSACYATRDGAVLYQDETHLSVEGSLLLVPGMRDVLAGVVD